jgi:hypothetical protein
MKTTLPIKKKEYFGKGSLRDLSAEGSLKKEYNPLTFLQLKEKECVVIVHPNGSLDQVCRVENHYIANPLIEKQLPNHFTSSFLLVGMSCRV